MITWAVFRSSSLPFASFTGTSGRLALASAFVTSRRASAITRSACSTGTPAAAYFSKDATRSSNSTLRSTRDGCDNRQGICPRWSNVLSIRMYHKKLPACQRGRAGSPANQLRTTCAQSTDEIPLSALRVSSRLWLASATASARNRSASKSSTAMSPRDVNTRSASVNASGVTSSTSNRGTFHSCGVGCHSPVTSGSSLATAGVTFQFASTASASFAVALSRDWASSLSLSYSSSALACPGKSRCFKAVNTCRTAFCVFTYRQARATSPTRSSATFAISRGPKLSTIGPSP